MKEYIFVYGQFRDSNKSLLGKAMFCGKASIQGKLYRVNDFYPGVVLNENGRVWGDVYLINSSVLPSLDKFEGDEYKRTKVRTSTDLVCWVYEYNLGVSGFKEILGGDWIIR